MLAFTSTSAIRSYTASGVAGVGFGGLRISSLLYGDEVVLLFSPSHDLQLAPGQFEAECA